MTRDGLAKSNCFRIFVIFALITNILSATEIKVTSDRAGRRLKLHYGAIVTASDSLFLDGVPLVRDHDYHIDYMSGAVILSDSLLTGYDTLRAVFTPLPTWLKKYYGEVVEKPGTGTVPPENRPAEIYRPGFSGPESAVSLRGAKRFAIATQSGGGSQFTQSLELTVSGEITPGLEITGSVADRGYDPQYGAINSRLSELDKMNMTLKSSRFRAEIGNLALRQPSPYEIHHLKEISGLSAVYQDRAVTGRAALGRPRGRLETVRKNGLDGIQGPYRINLENRSEPIVPGSETVWLDGRRLERGADKDYVMDYPAASITFSPRAPIDSRSRIEIDFEPLLTDFQREFYETGADVALRDSTVMMGFNILYEGDDRNRLKSGILSEDDIAFLAGLGDDPAGGFAEGARIDSLGDYQERFDTLGLRYYEYVGPGGGDYRVTFTAVDAGTGEYVYDGNERYRYVGPGAGNYLPLRRLPIASRQVLYEATTEIKLRPQVSLGGTFRRSDWDRNLFSNTDDGDNQGGEYVFELAAGAAPGIGSSRSGLSLKADFMERNFQTAVRNIRPDLKRSYLIPEEFIPSEGQNEINAACVFNPPGPYSLYMTADRLEYESRFNSVKGELTFYPDNKGSLWPSLTYGRLEAQLDTLSVTRRGQGDKVSFLWQFQPDTRTSLSTQTRYERRTHDYAAQSHGTTEKEIRLLLNRGRSSLILESYFEDTMDVAWRENLKRYRGTFESTIAWKALVNHVYFLAQRSERQGGREDQLMSRWQYAWHPARSGFSLTGNFGLSDESRFQRGVSYVRVEPGQGRYVFEDGQYIPDPAGDYIEVEEILSARDNISRGEKALGVNYQGGDVFVRGQASIEEEMLGGNSRDIRWLVPFYSDDEESYLYRKISYSGDIKLWAYPGYYFVSLSGSYGREDRRIGESTRERLDQAFTVTFHESKRAWHVTQAGEIFQYSRDEYYTAGGKIDGFKAVLGVAVVAKAAQINLDLAYRQAEDEPGNRSRQYLISTRPAVRFNRQGETSLEVELYRQDTDLSGSDFSGLVSYRLTDNKSGRRGVIWNWRTEYKLGGSLKAMAAFSGRHADDRRPRLYGRGELIASF